MKLRFFPLIVCVLLAFGFSLARASATKDALYLSFEQKVAAAYALAAYQKSPEEQKILHQKAFNYFNTWSQQPEEVREVANFEEFLKLYRGDWPATQSLDLDLQIIENRKPQRWRYQARSSRVQRQIDFFIEKQNESLSKMALSAPALTTAAGTLWHEVGTVPSPETVFKKVSFIIGEQFKEMEQIGAHLAESEMAQKLDPAMRIVMKTLFNEYFRRLGIDSKKLIAQAYLNSNLYLSDLQKFEIMIQNSGPQLQKLLQVIAREPGVSPELLAIFKNLESTVRPVPWVQVEKMLREEKDNFKFTFFEKKPLGVGTMAQVHRAKILFAGKEKSVVVRFIKPGIEARVQEDHRILQEVARLLDGNPEFSKTGMPKITPIVDDITRTVQTELDQEATIQRQVLAKSRYEKTVLMETPGYKNYIEFHVPEIYASKAASKFMVQEMVFGHKLDKETKIYEQLMPDLKKALSEALVANWIQEVLMGQGFFHSDLHQGNFLVNLQDERIRVSLLDYGMGGTISRTLQNNLLSLGAGMELMDANMIAAGLLNVSVKSKNTVSGPQFCKLVTERLRFLSPVEAQSIDGWMAWALNQGLSFSYEFINLNRGFTIMNKLLQDSGSSQDVSMILKKIAMKHPMSTYTRMVESKVSYKDIIRLGWRELTQRTQPQTPAPVSRCEQVFL